MAMQELSDQELLDLNDEVTQFVNDEGVFLSPDSEDEAEALNDLVHRVASLREKERAMIQGFIAELSQ